MDDKNLKQNENEEVVPSLDDMMAEAIPAEEQVAVEVTVADAPSEEATSEDVADQIQDSPNSPIEETEVVDPAPMEEASTEEVPTETATDMIEEAAADSAEEAAPVVEEKIQPSLPSPKVYRGKWYIVHTYSGHENKVAKTLMQRVQAMGFERKQSCKNFDAKSSGNGI